MAKKSKNMNAHKVETILAEDGTLILHDLPFHAGDTVEVIILEAKIPQDNVELLKQPKANFYPMRGKVVRYDNPTSPVAVEDWEVLQ